MKKIRLIEVLAGSGPSERSELAQRIFDSMANRLLVGENLTVELVALILDDVIGDYQIDKHEKAL